jgi:hypothetical protein
LTDDRAFGADDVASALYTDKRIRKLRFLMTDNIHSQACQKTATRRLFHVPGRDVDQQIANWRPALIHDVGSIYWNNFRKRWIAIVEQDGGFVDNGEIWYAEADSPTGPWIYARKVATHPHYNFYNPAHHPFFDQQNGRRIYFEGTYTDAFSERR